MALRTALIGELLRGASALEPARTRACDKSPAAAAATPASAMRCALIVHPHSMHRGALSNGAGAAWSQKKKWSNAAFPLVTSFSKTSSSFRVRPHGVGGGRIGGSAGAFMLEGCARSAASDGVRGGLTAAPLAALALPVRFGLAGMREIKTKFFSSCELGCQ